MDKHRGVIIVGHMDHGKTSILEQLQKEHPDSKIVVLDNEEELRRVMAEENIIRPPAPSPAEELIEGIKRDAQARMLHAEELPYIAGSAPNGREKRRERRKNNRKPKNRRK